MAEKKNTEEKFYTAEEVARAVLKKAHEMLKASNLMKANTSHEIENGGEPSNDEAEAPDYLASADIENSGAHGEKTKKKNAGPEGDISEADKDKDGDVDGDDAIEAQEEASGKDLDGDKESGESAEHKAKIAAAAKPAPKDDSAKDPKEAVKAATEEKNDKKAPPFAKSEPVHTQMEKPSLKKFMLQRKMNKTGAPSADSRLAEKLSGSPAAPTPAAKVKENPKLEMEKNKSVEKLMGIAPKAGK